MFTLGHNKFLIQINYKSGTSMQMWCYNFSLEHGRATWQGATHTTPLRLSIDDIESVWTVKIKRGLLGQKKEP